ncbi:MAG: TatD family hydrolase, partial [Geminicoccales bacterium]
MIDSHCHLAGEEFAADLEAVVQRARDARLAHVLVILAADDDKELAQAERVGTLWPEARFSIGVHPHASGRFAEEGRAVAAVERALAGQPRVRGLGEIGLDYHYDFAPRDVQQAVFRRQLQLAHALDLPVVIHTREADEDTT